MRRLPGLLLPCACHHTPVSSEGRLAARRRGQPRCVGAVRWRRQRRRKLPSHSDLLTLQLLPSHRSPSSCSGLYRTLQSLCACSQSAWIYSSTAPTASSRVLIREQCVAFLVCRRGQQAWQQCSCRPCSAPAYGLSISAFPVLKGVDIGRGCHSHLGRRRPAQQRGHRQRRLLRQRLLGAVPHQHKVALVPGDLTLDVY